jgi:prevent-host-death family protein
MKVTSTDFQQNVGRYQDAALQTPVAITKNGRPHTVLMSAALFEVLVRGRIARPVEDLDDDTLKAIANSAVPPEFAAALDKIVKDWSP